jgi:hypothetical protein
LLDGFFQPHFCFVEFTAYQVEQTEAARRSVRVSGTEFVKEFVRAVLIAGKTSQRGEHSDNIRIKR